MSWGQQTPYQAPPGGQFGSQPPPGHGNFQPGSQPYQTGYGTVPSQSGYGASPGPGGYGVSPGPGGYGAGPGSGAHNPGPGQGSYGVGQAPYSTQQGSMYNAPTGPPPGVTQELWDWFRAVDTDKSGQITATELQQALCNGNWTPFNAETCRLMIGMFDRDRNGTINVQEFAALWKYIQDWKACFDRFDTDRSGNINATELANAFRSFGYNLSMNFVNVCMRTYDTHQRGCINFDNFIQCCVLLKSLTDQFRMRDTQQNGTIRIQYEEFLRMVLDTSR